MEYYKYIDKEVNINRIMYGEYDNEYYCIRAIFEKNSKLVTTNFIDNEYFLPEGSFCDYKNNLGEEITEIEFYKLWEMALKPFENKWNELKNKYKIGNNIKANINCIYPQGIILDIGEIFYGVGNYKECEMKYTSKYLYPKNEMNMKIIDFDEKDMWIKLKPE
jgi:hypothetical protein